MKRILIAFAAAALLCTGAHTQSLEAIEKAEEAVVAAWSATPLTVRRAVFVAEPPQGFGVYRERADADFRPGEPLIVYAEPVGYAWKDNGDGSYSFGFNVDLLLKSPGGETVSSQENFQKLELTSRARNREFMLTLTLNVTGAPAGDYIVEYVLHDLNGEKTGAISLPFTIAE